VPETLAWTLGAGRSLAACNRRVSRVAEPLAGCKPHALETPPPMLLVEGMGVKRASPPGACRRAAPGRRRAGKRKQTRGVRSALGGWPAGPWDIGHWKGAEGERADTWQACLGALSLTGGTEATTDLVVSDGANGLESALEHPRSGVAPQRCMFHTITQLADQVVCGTLPVAPSSAAAQAPRQAKRQRTKAVWVEASWVYDGASETPRRERAEVFRQAWVDRAPDAGANFLVDFDKPFASVSLAFPAPFRGLIRTTHLLERLHKERRRKQRDIGMLQSEQGCETLWYVLSRRETAKQRALLQSRW